MTTCNLLGVLQIVTDDTGDVRFSIPSNAPPLTPDRARAIANWLERWSDGEERKEQSNG